jgi:hypothetical protein
MRATIFFLVILLLLMGSLYANKVVPLPHIFKPHLIVVESEQIYIAEETTIYIYSLKDFGLKKKFGKEGQGPSEFGGSVESIEIQPDYILVNSLRKVSFFTKDGDFMNEKKTRSALGGSLFKPIGNQFVGYSIERDKSTFYVVYSIFDSDIKKSKELYRMKWIIQPGQKRRLFETFWYSTFDNKIFIAREGFIIDVFDAEGKKLFSINQKYKNLRFTDSDKKKIVDQWKSDSRTNPYWQRLLERTEFPRYFPAIKTCLLSDRKLYVQTYKGKDEKIEFYIFKINGEFEKKALIPIIKKNPLEYYPYTIKNGKIYQLVYDLEKYAWELHITKIN